MITKSITNVVHSAQGGVLQFNFMQGNMLKNMLAGDIMLNLFDTPRLDMAIANIFLRQLDDSGIVRVTPLLFHNDQLVTYKNAQDEIIWQTTAPDFTAFVTLSFSHEQEETYYYSVRVEITARRRYAMI